MIYSILLILKIILFINITEVKNNTIWVFLLSSLFIISIYSLIYFLKKKNRDRTGFIVYLVLSLILLIDVLHYTYFNKLPTVKMLSQAGQVAAVTDAVKEIFTFKNILVIADLPVLLAYTIWKIKKNKKGKRSKEKIYDKSFRFGLPILCISLLVLNIGFLKMRGKLESVSNQELFTYHIKDIKRVIKDEDVSQAVDNYKMGEIIDEMKERARLKDGKHTGIAKGKNLVVIQVESLQDFVINDKYEGQEITPNINKLIKDQGSLYFDNYYQSIASGNTSDGEFTTNNSIHPSIGEPSYTEYQDKTFYGLPWLLRDNGYKAWAFHGYEKSFWNREKAYPNQGFERFISQEDYKIKEKIGFGLRDEDFFKQSMPYLKEMSKDGQEPFYAFMISLTSHNPYKIPKKYHKIKLKDKHKDTLLGNYLQAVHYTDEAIGDFIEELKKEGLYDNTVIALYGDHFGISSIVEDNKKMMTDYLGKEYDLDEMMKIPLVINVPGENIKETISSVGSQMDFYPTIQNLMGYDNPKGLVFGRDLLNLKEAHYVMPQSYTLRGSFITDDIFFNMSRDGVFENSRAFNKDTRELINPAKFRNMYERVIAELSTSDYIMKHNLLKDILEGKDIKEDFKTETETISKKFIEIEPDLDLMREKVKEGYDGFKLTMRFNPEKGRVYVGDISYDQIEVFLKENPQVNLLMEFEDIDYLLTVLTAIKEYNPEAIDQTIIDLKDISLYQGIAKQGFKQIYDTNAQSLSKTALKDIFIKYPDLKYISLDRRQANSNYGKELKEKGLYTLVRIKDEKKIKKIKEENIKGYIIEK